MMQKYNTVDEYINSFSGETKEKLNQLRKTILKTAGEAEEKMSYGMPAYKLQGMLLYFAAWKNHIGFYVMTSGIEVFKKELSKYKVSKGTVQFPLDKPLPLGLISKIVLYRVAENLKKAELKRKK